MEMFWFSPDDYVTGDPTLQISHSFSGQPHTAIKCSTLGGDKWISMAVTLPPDAEIEAVLIGYQVSNPRSRIVQVRLSELNAPDKPVVRHDDPTKLDSVTPAVYRGNVIAFAPKAALTLELRLDFANTADVIRLGGVGVEVLPSCEAEENRHSLATFGPYDTLDKARTTLAQAVKAIVAQGGGVLCLPRDAPAEFYPRNLSQQAHDKPAVTIIDYRHGIERIYAPAVGATNSDVTAVAGRIIERDLTVDLPWQNVFSTQDIASRYLGGASSYFVAITEKVDKGKDRNIYVPTLRGAFVGQTLVIDPGADQEWIVVKSLGRDATGSFLVAELTKDHPQGVYLYNKNFVNGLTITDISNCDNQSASLAVDRRTYGTGDSFLFSGTLTYQGNIMSGLGDEGAVGVAANLEHDINGFSGEVESWTLKSPAMEYVRELVYKTNAVAPQKLGTSRPIINMNPAKAITSGRVNVIAPGYDYKREASPSPSAEISTSFIIGDAAVGWDQSVVGRFIAIDVPTEYYEKNEAAAIEKATERVYRWWHITGLEKRKDGLWNLFVERTFFDTSLGAGPTLLRFDNYTIDDATYMKNKLAYLIAPGAWVSDARDAVAGNTPGNIGAAQAGDERRLKLAPSSSEGTRFDFDAGDKITNPPGPDVWMPTGFRARHFHNFPAALPGASFLSENFGKVQVGYGLFIAGQPGTLADVAAAMKDKATSYECGVCVSASSDVAFSLRGPVRKGAIDFWQPQGNIHALRWFVKDGAGASTLYADPVTGNFMLAGGDIDLQLNGGTINQIGLSATSIPAQNLSGVGVDVASGAISITVTLPREEPDADYAVLVECSWLTLKAITNKTAKQFTVEFSAAPGVAGGKLDWFLVR